MIAKTDNYDPIQHYMVGAALYWDKHCCWLTTQPKSKTNAVVLEVPTQDDHYLTIGTFDGDFFNLENSGEAGEY